MTDGYAVTTRAEVIDDRLVIVETETFAKGDVESYEWRTVIPDIDDDTVIEITEADIIVEFVLPA